MGNIKLSGKPLATVVVTIGVALFIIVMFYKYGFKVESKPFEVKMAYIRNLSLEASLPQLNSTEICETDGCFEAAEELLSTMDGKRDPCSDFFKFACDRFLYTKPESPFPPKGDLTVENKTEIILGILQEKNATDPKSLSQAKLFYKKCLDLEAEDKGLSVLLELIKSYGGWLLLGEKWNGSEFNWLEMAGKASGIVSAIISVREMMDLNNSSKKAIYMGYPTFGVPKRALLEPVKYSSFINGYRQFVNNVINEISSVNKTKLRKSVEKIVDFEIKLAQLVKHRHGLGEHWKRYKLSELKNITGLEWSVYFDNYFNDSDIKVDGNEEIFVADIDYFKGLKMLKDEKAKTIANYIIWKVVSSLASFTNKRIRNVQLKYISDSFGRYEKPNMEALCVRFTDEVFSFAIGAKYLENNVDWIDSNNKIVEGLADEMKTSFIETVGEANWIGNETKGNIIEKIKGIRGFIGYPEWLLNWSEVRKYYDGLELGESFIESVINVRFWLRNKSIMKLRKAADKNEWRMSVWENSAQFHYDLNAFTIPFIYNLPPNYDRGRPQYQNYARLGWTLGHEIMHALDKSGRFFDKDGNMRNWWDDESKRKYEKKMDCITKWFGQYNFSYPFSYPNGMGLDGRQILAENMADIGANQISFRAYQKYIKENGAERGLPGLESYTPEQLFFISNANNFCADWYSYTTKQLVHLLLTDTHSPLETRLNWILNYSEDFKKAFNCKRNVSQVETENCQLW